MGRLDTIKRQRLDRRLLTSNFPQDLVPEVLDIPDYIQLVDIEDQKVEATKEVDHRVQKSTTVVDDVPVPLTEAQSEAVDLRMKAALSNIEVARAELKNVRELLEKRINDQNNESIAFQIDVDKKPRLLRAIKKLWGEKRTELTFDMYKELLEAKQALESQEIEAFSSGKIKR